MAHPVAATFIEPLACVLRAQDRAGLRAGDSLLVVGAGVQRACSPSPPRMHARSRRCGCASRATAACERREACGAEHHGNELVDVAIVCTPKPDGDRRRGRGACPRRDAVPLRAAGPGRPPPLDGTALFLRELTVTASYSAGPADMRAALELIAGGVIDPLPLVSHRLPLAEAARALDLQRSGEA